MARKGLLALAGAAALAAAGCGGGGSAGTGGSSSGGAGPGASHRRGSSATSVRPPVSAPRTLHLSSPAFANGATIPARYTCTGADVSPPLRWSGVPSGARELALVIIDPDAPGGSFTHWVLAGIPPSESGFPAHLGLAGAVPGRNDFGKLLYRGPCPPPGKPHRYVFELLALPAPSGLTPGFRIAALKRLRPLAAGVLVGTFVRR
jgi:Raf kinase inhibitor-like YbhB/YbcL family protein